MIKKSIFREYDIRGIVDEELNEQSVKLIGYYLGLEIIKKTVKTPYVVVGYDARTHSPRLFEYLTSGFNKAGVKVLGMGMVATGVNYFASYQTFNGIKPNASVMITGSHNPSEYNGFKISVNNTPFFADDIYALGDEIIKNQNIKIEDNKQFEKINAKAMYIDFMLKEFSPDGTFPNHHPDPSEEKNLKDLKELLKDEALYGFAYDGDADRIAFLTKKYNVKGDILALLFAKTMKDPIVVGEVKCTQVMYDIINETGKAIMYKTGHSNLKVKLKEVNAHLAAEVSGHIFFNDRFYGFDDAVYATFRILELIHNGMDIDKQIEKLPKTYSTEEIKIKTTEDEKFLLIDKIKELLKNPPKNFPKIVDIIDVDGVRINFRHGWGLVRASNTTPVLVTRFESTNEQTAKEYEEEVNKLILLAKDELSNSSN
jgi:phosphomannomutase/phosphoglucomutase